MRHLSWLNSVWILEIFLWGIGITQTESFLQDPSHQFSKDPLRSILGASKKKLPHYYRGNLGDGKKNHGDKDNHGRQRAPERSTDRPTETLVGIKVPAVAPSKPKIVVLGATGRIGRLVVRQLLEMESIDMTVVAFVRDYDKAIRVLYDDMLVANTNPKGPKLQIVEGDLVPSEELPGYPIHDQEDEQLWLENAKSAAKYFGNQVQDYDNRDLLPDTNESLEEALKGCTTVISCLGSFRPTNIWTDWLARPLWRLLRPDVSPWCTDGRHPYYVHYTSTRKVLGYVEREQRRREAAVAASSTSSIEESPTTTQTMPHVPRIRLVRISDLGVAQKPWHFVPWVTNVVQSVVFRYHEMAEQLLESSSIIETVVLRPGDLVDEERDVNTTSLQVCHTGTVPLPARVGREDVASLAVAAAMFQTPTHDEEKQHPHIQKDSQVTLRPDPFHYTLACRWVGQHLDPFPAQGVKADGCPDAATALRKSLKLIAKNERRQRALQRRRRNTGTIVNDDNPSNQELVFTSSFRRRRKRKPQPHGLCVAVPVYIMMGLFARTLLQPLIAIMLPGRPTILGRFVAQCHQWFWMMPKIPGSRTCFCGQRLSNKQSCGWCEKGFSMYML